MEVRGEHLVLTSASIEQAPALLPAFNGDEQFNQWSGHTSPLTLTQVQADILETLNQPGGVVWRIADRTEALVGVAKTALLPSLDTAWLDLLIIRRAFQGRGYGSEAATLLETHLFSSAQIKQIGLAVMIQNTPAMAFWEKRGYVRGERYLDNEGDDVYAYLLPCPRPITYTRKGINRMNTIPIQNWRQGEYLISTEKSRLDIDVIHRFLSTSYWAKGIPRQVVEQSIEHSLPFGIYKGEQQVGFARVITDYATFAYIGDVFVLEDYRGLGLSKWLMQTIVEHPSLQGLRRWILLTRDAHDLYRKVGFAAPASPERYMERVSPDVYKP